MCVPKKYLQVHEDTENETDSSSEIHEKYNIYGVVQKYTTGQMQFLDYRVRL